MTRTVEVTRTLNAPVESVFLTFSDSDRLASLPGVRVEILREGTDGRDGVGLKRRVSFPFGFLVEEVVGLEEPGRFDYLIRDASVPLHHEFGRIAFERDGDRTRVVWTTRFRVPAGLLTGPVEAAAAAVTHVAFTAVLMLVDRNHRTSTGRART